jgi:hypothetical protein
MPAGISRRSFIAARREQVAVGVSIDCVLVRIDCGLAHNRQSRGYCAPFTSWRPGMDLRHEP